MDAYALIISNLSHEEIAMTEWIRNEKLQPDTVDEIAAASGIG